jgi:hypothetical protein
VVELSDDNMDGIVTDVPGDSQNLDNFVNHQNDPMYLPNVTTDRDRVQTPKEDDSRRWETPDFFEFTRTFACKRNELIYLLKGIAYEKKFTLVLKADNHTKTYRLINMGCANNMHKLRKMD